MYGPMTSQLHGQNAVMPITWSFCANVAGPTNFNQVQSRALVRADTTISSFSA